MAINATAIKLPSKNIYKSFRSPSDLTTGSNALVNNSKRWDEPTYLTFSVFFKMGESERWRNQTRITNFDRFPHPLLNTYKEDNYDARNEYSTIQFLRDNNETVREEMLGRFINDLDDIQTYYPWYFQSISGINSLLNVKTDRGRRVPEDAKLSFNVLEGIDQKMTTILNLYKKVAWDDTYQRWMLPDMMRNFVMEIYITEFRTFHESRIKDQQGQTEIKDRNFFGNVANYLYTNVPVIQNAVNAFKPSTTPEYIDLVLDSMHKTMPTIKITCERCEIDINSINKHIDSYSVGDIPEMQSIDFDIKVGQITEEHINPILDYFFSDKIINGRDRSIAQNTQIPSADTATAFLRLPGAITPLSKNLADDAIRTSSTKGKHALNNPDIAQREANAYPTHTSGTPFNEMINDKKAIHNRLGSDGTTPPSSTFQPDVNASIPNTWGGNAVKFGLAAAENFVQEKIAKGAMTKIPGLGISVNEAISAVETKDFITVFGTIADAVRKVLEQTAGPSEELNKPIYESTVRRYLTTIIQSEATDGDILELKKFASKALLDKSILGKILDYSVATDLVSSELNEKNIPNPINNPNNQIDIVNTQTKGDRSQATDLDGDNSNLSPEHIIYDGVPSSGATSNPIITG